MDMSFHRWNRQIARSIVELGCMILIMCALVGCADHRISLADFLDMQQEVRQTRVVTLSAAELEAARELLDRRLGPYRVGPSDVLTVTLTNVAETALFAPVLVRVDSKGEIDLPLVGALRVADMELEAVDDAIRNAYVPGIVKDAVVHVEVTTAESTNVMVKGAVTMPGLVALRRTERNLLFAIVGAGGASDLASGEVTLRRIRRPTEEITLDLSDPAELRAALALKPLEDGDIVNVRAAVPNTVLVGGLVNAPRPQAYPPGVEVSVLQAIAAAGGLRTDVFPREGTLIRRMPDGRDVHVKLALNRIADGRDPNILLAAGDILWVPETFGTRVQDFINRNFFLRAGVSVNYSVTGIEFLNRRSMQTSRLGGGLEDSFDPFGFLTRGTTLQSLSTQPLPSP